MQVVEIPPDHEGATDDVAVRNETPVTAVIAAVPVVTHHEIITGGHLAGETIRVVIAILPVGELAVDLIDKEGRHGRLHQDSMCMPT